MPSLLDISANCTPVSNASEMTSLCNVASMQTILLMNRLKFTIFLLQFYYYLTLSMDSTSILATEMPAEKYKNLVCPTNHKNLVREIRSKRMQDEYLNL